jgi:hypothetical protein
LIQEFSVAGSLKFYRNGATLLFFSQKKIPSFLGMFSSLDLEGLNCGFSASLEM